MMGNARIAEVDTDITNTQTTLADKKSDYVNLQVKLESRMSLDKVEQYATKKLGLAKIQNYQITYLNVDKGDRVQVTGANENPVLAFFDSVGKELKAYFH
jgi:hypothetical protein